MQQRRNQRREVLTEEGGQIEWIRALESPPCLQLWTCHCLDIRVLRRRGWKAGEGEREERERERERGREPERDRERRKETKERGAPGTCQSFQTLPQVCLLCCTFITDFANVKLARLRCSQVGRNAPSHLNPKMQISMWASRDCLQPKEKPIQWGPVWGQQLLRRARLKNGLSNGIGIGVRRVNLWLLRVQNHILHAACKGPLVYAPYMDHSSCLASCLMWTTVQKLLRSVQKKVLHLFLPVGHHWKEQMQDFPCGCVNFERFLATSRCLSSAPQCEHSNPKHPLHQFELCTSSEWSEVWFVYGIQVSPCLFCRNLNGLLLWIY